MAFLQQLRERPSSPQGSEDEVIRRINWGDQSALENLFRQYYDGLCRFMLGVTRSPNDVEDLVQEIFVRIWRNRVSWHPKGSIKSYLFKAARNQAVNLLKTKESRSAPTSANDDTLLSDPSTDPAKEMFDRDISANVENAILRLPEKCRLVFTLNRQEDLSYSEIADVLGISVKTVENQIAHALKVLRIELKELIKS